MTLEGAQVRSPEVGNIIIAAPDRDVRDINKLSILADLIWRVADVKHIGGTPTEMRNSLPRNT